MIAELSSDLALVLQEAEKKPWLARSTRDGNTTLDRPAIQALLPHRGLFLLIDEAQVCESDMKMIVARYALSRAHDIFAGHFPFRPVWPGVLQVEAIAQAGILLYLKLTKAGDVSNLAMTHILQARFIHPVVPGGDVEIVARVFEDGLFFTIIGQCLQNGRVCSVAALRGIL